MGIKANFNMDDVRKRIEEKRTEIIDAIKEAFNLACLNAVARAKQTNTYIDQTGNLRSSIGYVLFYNGVEVGSFFKSEPTARGSGVEGAKKGLDFARKVAEESSKSGFVAVVVAGEDYARYVEAKGFDVLTGSTLRFADELKESFKNINDKLGTKL